VAVFFGASGKRLYYGRARTSEIFSVALDGRGDVRGEPRRELSLADLPNPSGDGVRRIRFEPVGSMVVHAYHFTYSLQVASERRERLFRYRYDAAADRWDFEAEIAAEEATVPAGTASPSSFP